MLYIKHEFEFISANVDVVSMKDQAMRDNLSPNECLKLISSRLDFTPKFKSALSMESFFEEITAESISRYTNEVVKAITDSDLNTLKQHNLQCCNRFGESALHLACRRGLSCVVKLMINDVSVRCRDDCGRTPLHDACWSALPDWEIIDLLISRDPTLLFLADKRGFTPLQYARKEHWPSWRHFLFDRIDCFRIHVHELKKYLS